MVKLMAKKDESEKKVLTLFEKARLIGARALQLAMGAPPLVKGDHAINSVGLAFEEYEKGVIPLRVIRSGASTPA
jgi:DNA-directed RNA polymerase subunit K